MARIAPCGIEGCPRPLARFLPALCQHHADLLAAWAKQQAELETRTDG